MTARATWFFRRRKAKNAVVVSLAGMCMVITLLPLFLILGYALVQGIGALNLDFFLNMPKPVGESGGGMANAIAGTGILIGLGALVGIPIGVLAGVYLAEYGANPFGSFLRFMTDVLSGVPSIIVGVAVYVLVVIPIGHFSALAGGVALGILMIPTIVRTTEEMIRLVPHSLREAGLALGIPRWRTTLRIVMPAALKGITTGILLALARAAGETAPLLFTSLGNRFWSTSVMQPIASLTVFIFDYAKAPFDDWNRQAWAASFVLIALIFLLSLIFRLVTRNPHEER